MRYVFAKLGLVAALVVIGVSSPAFAWRQSASCIRLDQVDPLAPSSAPRCSSNERPIRFFHPQREVTYRVSRDLPPELRNGSDVVKSAVEVWNAPECSDFRFVSGPDSDAGANADDDINWVGFVDDWPYSTTAVAVTSVTTNEDGTIVDADIELNGSTLPIGIVDSSTTDEVFDLASIVTHESGHMLGLDHSAVADATMQFETPPLEIDKRSLDNDDIEGLCTIYPLDEPEPPTMTSDGCCRTGSGDREVVWVLLVFVACIIRRQKRAMFVC